MMTVSPKGQLFLGITWWLVAMVILVVAARFWVRIRMLRALGADDWLMLIAALLLIVGQALETVAANLGLGNPVESMPPQQLFDSLMYAWIYTTPSILSTIFARASIAVLLIRLFGTKRWFRTYLIIITVIQTVLELLVIAFIWAECTPVAGLWNPTIGANCWTFPLQRNTAYAGQAVFTLSDLTYIVVPVAIVWRLNMQMKKKIGLMLIFSVGIFTVAASLMKLITTATPGNSEDSIWTSSIWSMVEQSLVIILGSVPSLRPLSSIDFASLRNLSYSLRNFARSRMSRLSGSRGTLNTDVDAEAIYPSTYQRYPSESLARSSDAGTAENKYNVQQDSNLAMNNIRKDSSYSVGVDHVKP